jgi:hypothetical protein
MKINKKEWLTAIAKKCNKEYEKPKKLDQYKKAIDEEDWYTIEKIQKEYKKLK